MFTSVGIYLVCSCLHIFFLYWRKKRAYNPENVSNFPVLKTEFEGGPVLFTSLTFPIIPFTIYNGQLPMKQSWFGQTSLRYLRHPRLLVYLVVLCKTWNTTLCYHLTSRTRADKNQPNIGLSSLLLEGPDNPCWKLLVDFPCFHLNFLFVTLSKVHIILHKINNIKSNRSPPMRYGNLLLWIVSLYEIWGSIIIIVVPVSNNKIQVLQV